MSRFFIFLFFSILFRTASCDFGSIGVNYGRIADNLPDPLKVVELLKSNGINRVKIFDTDASVLSALAGSGISVTVAMPNEVLASAASDKSSTDAWIKSNIAPFYPNTKIEAIAVGNEVFVDPKNTPYLVPAMHNMFVSLQGLNFDIKVSSPVALSALENSYPPSSGSFKAELIEPVIIPMLNLIRQTGSYFMVNSYPFFAYEANTDTISLDYALLNPNSGVKDSGNGRVYKSLFEAQLDAVFAALDALHFNDIKVVVSETGWPSAGGDKELGAGVENAASYNGNLVRRVLTGGGTPLRPNDKLNVFLFALFNENQKTGPVSERNYGLFYPNEQKVYDIPLSLNALNKGGGLSGTCNFALGSCETPTNGAGTQKSGPLLKCLVWCRKIQSLRFKDRVRVGFSNSVAKVFDGKNSCSFVVCGGNGDGLRGKKGFTEKRRKMVSAISRSGSVGLNGEMNGFDVRNGGSSSLSKYSCSRNFEEYESNNCLRRLVKSGELEESFRFLESMVYRGDIPDIIPCTSLIRGFCRLRKTKMATRVLEILEESGAVPDVITYNVLISGYCKVGEIDNALEVLDRMSVAPDVVTYNTILRSLCDRGKLSQAMEVLDRQLRKECYPDVFTYTILIEATCKESGVDQAMKLLDEMSSKGCKPDVVTYNVLINGICKEGRLDEAIKFLDNMSSLYGCRPNVITHNIILRSMCSTGRWMDAEKLLTEMVRKGCSPSVVTFNILINFLCRKGLLGRAIDILEQMPKHGCTPNSLSYNPLLHGFCKEKKMDRAIEYLEIMMSRGCYPDIVTYNTLLTALCKDGKVGIAVEILNQLSSKGCSPVLITYNTVIDGLAKIGKTESAIELLDEMRGKGLQPDIITYSSLVGGLSREGKIEEAVSFFYDLEGLGVRPNAITYNTLMLGLCKARRTDRAIDFLISMVAKGCKPTEVTYTILIEGLAYEGLTKEALEILSELCSRGAVKRSSAQQMVAKI
ncbi:hypothetical protein AgCh_007098 [Apium graveolens]